MLNPIDIDIGARIRKRRRYLQISQESLCEALGVTNMELQRFENGSSRIGAKFLQKLCKELKVTPSHFLTMDAPSPTDAAPERDSVVADSARLNEAFLMLEGPELRKLVIDLTVSLSQKRRVKEANPAGQAAAADASGETEAIEGAADTNIINIRRYLASGPKGA
jgi:transcriptional regulator with XRE-family HTH domain